MCSVSTSGISAETVAVRRPLLLRSCQTLGFYRYKLICSIFSYSFVWTHGDQSSPSTTRSLGSSFRHQDYQQVPLSPITQPQTNFASLLISFIKTYYSFHSLILINLIHNTLCSLVDHCPYCSMFLTLFVKVTSLIWFKQYPASSQTSSILSLPYCTPQSCSMLLLHSLLSRAWQGSWRAQGCPPGHQMNTWIHCYWALFVFSHL